MHQQLLVHTVYSVHKPQNTSHKAHNSRKYQDTQIRVDRSQAIEERARPRSASTRAAPKLAAGFGDAAAGERFAGVGAVDVATVCWVPHVQAEARLLGAQVGAARRRGRRPVDERRRAHRQLPRVALLRRRHVRTAHRRCYQQHHRKHRDRLARHRLRLVGSCHSRGKAQITGAGTG